LPFPLFLLGMVTLHAANVADQLIRCSKEERACICFKTGGNARRLGPRATPPRRRNQLSKLMMLRRCESDAFLV
jgi:hypothetical protein